GIASDGNSLFITTGNAGLKGITAEWMDGEAIIRLAPGPTFSKRTADYFAPLDWKALDEADADLSGTGPIPFHVAGATPADLVIALGKDGKAYLADRANLGGVSAGVVVKRVSGDQIIN